MAGMTANLPAVMQAGGTVLQTIGAFTAGSAARRAGESRAVALNWEAAQLRQNAGQAIAASQRAAEEERRRARLVASRALAVAAASGGGASDLTVQRVISDLDGEGAYRAMVALYQGEERAQQLRLAASGRLYDADTLRAAGRQQQDAYQIAGLTALGKGASSFFLKYGRGGPSGVTSAGAPASWGDSATLAETLDTGDYG